MKHPRIDSIALTARITAALAANEGDDASFCRKTNIPYDRLSKFRNGRFSRLTPLLETLCQHLEIEWKDLLIGKSELQLEKTVSELAAAYPNKLTHVRRLLESLAKLAKS